MQHEAVRSLRHGTDDRPFIVFWEVTRACGLACAHCRADALPHRDPRELSTVEAQRLIDDLAAYDAPRPILVLTGGDPFERDDLAELVRYATQRGLHVSLSPSVTPRLTPARLAELRSAGASAVSLSLDGARPETHDALRGIEGTYRDTLLAAALVRDAGFRLQINTTVHAGNVDELPDLLAWLVDQDVSLWSVFVLVPTGRGAADAPTRRRRHRRRAPLVARNRRHAAGQDDRSAAIPASGGATRCRGARGNTPRRGIPARRAPQASGGADSCTRR